MTLAGTLATLMNGPTLLRSNLPACGGVPGVSDSEFVTGRAAAGRAYRLIRTAALINSTGCSARRPVPCSIC